MTLEEIRKYLNNTKVYVDGKSREIQEKLFAFGYRWGFNNTKVSFEEIPFLYINENSKLTYGIDMPYFKEHENREISADEILSIEIT